MSSNWNELIQSSTGYLAKHAEPKGLTMKPLVMARDALFATVMVAFVTLGHWLGMKEEDE